ncbi:MAG: LysR substrate-binding domain-containing protein [Paracoccaceae bacterium]|nr:LysR substrate-binding domain-containing protein [Paracoccaceae bacterium]MDG2257612.1 LysR substrate-binding domain-containing protein [Paracoccaceae bacterium]
MFDVVSRLKSITLAAQSLNISQSSVSYHIKKLEDELQVHLFVRNRGGLAPTSQGKILASHVESGLRSIQVGLDQISGHNEAVRVAILPMFASRWLSPRLGDFWDAQPDIQLSFRNHNNTFAAKERPSDFAELGILWGLGDWEDFQSTRLWSEKMVVVCSPEYMRENPITLASELKNCTLLHVDDETRWQEWFANNQLEFSPSQAKLIPQEPHFQLSSTVNGLGVALFPYSMIQNELETGVLINMFGRTFDTSFAYYLGIPNGVSLTRSAIVFKKWLLSQCRG